MATLDGKQIKSGTVTSTQVDNTVVAVGKTVTFSSGVVTLSGTGDIRVPNTPLVDTSVVNKAYVDAVAQGFDVKDSVQAVTAAALPAYTRDGNVITSDSAALGSIDGQTIIATNRILVKNGTSGTDNGIYTVTRATAPYILTRSTDADSSAEVTSGMFCWAIAGTLNGLKGWCLTTADPITLNTTALTFTQVSQAASPTWGGITGTLSAQTDLQSALDAKVDENAAITGSTQTKITYDAKGLVTAGAQATVDDLADGTNYHAVTTAEKTKLSNLSGTNTGDISLTAVGSSPNANAATLTLQALNLELASASYPGLITAAQYTLLGNTSGSNSGDVSVGTTTTAQANGASISSQVLHLSVADASNPGLMVAADFSKLAAISGTNTGDQSLATGMRNLTASATTADYDQATATTMSATNTHGGEVAVFVNGSKQFVGDGTRAADCYFGATSAAARAFSAIIATDKLYWVGSQAGFQLAATDRIDIMFMP